MIYKVKSIAVFEKQAKRLIKKFPSLKKELLELVQELKENPEHGTPIGRIVLKSVLPLLLKVRANRRGKSDYLFCCYGNYCFPDLHLR
jgi:mRNA-degrading endonuclease RelE of RelBE toxin-antitoxin system